MKTFLLIGIILLSLIFSSSLPKLKIENSCIKLKVGNSNITLALDPSSNVNYIFDGSLDKYKDKSYKKDLSLVLKTSSVIMTSSNVFGLFSGNLAVDEFYFPFILAFVFWRNMQASSFDIDMKSIILFILIIYI